MDSTLDICVRIGALSDIGRQRERNEDACVVSGSGEIHLGDHGILLSVFDGMGGCPQGHIASGMAADHFRRWVAKGIVRMGRDELARQVTKTLESANRDIIDRGKRDSTCFGMGTTSTVACASDGDLLIGHVGDSRAYILRAHRLVQMTEDHTLAAEHIKDGTLTIADAKSSIERHTLVRALGVDDPLDADLTIVSLRKNDIILLCTDGLYEPAEEDIIRLVLETYQDPEKACEELVSFANHAGGYDNITAIVARVSGDSLPDPTVEDVTSLARKPYHAPSRPITGRPQVAQL